MLQRRRFVAVLVVSVFLATFLASCSSGTSGTSPTTGPVVNVTSSQALASVYQSAPAGATLSLADGTYTLSDTLKITKDITLKGSGSGKVTITMGNAATAPASGDWAPVVEIPGNSFTCNGVTIKYTGTEPSDVVTAYGDAKLDIKDCAFTGGVVGTGSLNFIGNGILLYGNATATIVNSTFTKNGHAGYAVDGNNVIDISTSSSTDNDFGAIFYATARGTVKGSTLSNNTSGGVWMGSSSAGDPTPTLSGNTLASNGGAGLTLSGKSKPTLDGNTIQGNGADGIMYQDSSSGTAKNNIIKNNAYDGIGYIGTSSGTAQNNMVTGNTNSGVYTGQSSTPTLDGNTLSSNGFAGVNVVETAAPTISNNTMDGNGASGIEFRNGSAGTAQNNTITNNQHSGIWLNESAAPTLDSNTVNGNGFDGITYHASSAGSATGNDVGANGEQGIHVWDSAAPTLSNNDVHDSPNSGIMFDGSAAGAADGNSVHANAQNGITVLSTSTPTVTSNDAQNNAECGVLSIPSSSPSVSGNTYAGNGVDGWCILHASSRDGFSGTQGQNGWSYGYYDGSSGTPYTNGDFQQLPSYDSTQQVWWFGSLTPYYTQVGVELMHPNGGSATPSDTLQWAVRRWTSDVSGSVTLFGHLYKMDTMTCSSCDGVTGHVLSGDTSLWSQSIAADDATGVNFALPVNVSVGSTVDFAVSPKTTNHADGSGMWVDVLQVQ